AISHSRSSFAITHPACIGDGHPTTGQPTPATPSTPDPPPHPRPTTTPRSSPHRLGNPGVVHGIHPRRQRTRNRQIMLKREFHLELPANPGTPQLPQLVHPTPQTLQPNPPRAHAAP